MQNVEWVMGEWVIPLRLLRLLEHLAVLINLKSIVLCATKVYLQTLCVHCTVNPIPKTNFSLVCIDDDPDKAGRYFSLLSGKAS